MLRADLVSVGAARVCFGHRSVGANILEGVRDLQDGLELPLIRIVEFGADDRSDGSGILLSAKVGRNEDPASKCEDFRRILGELRGRVDVALLKFCYVDIGDGSDPREIFNVYSHTLGDLKRTYPDITFVHVTAPLRTVDRGPGVWVRESLGRRNRAKHANVRRGEFNRLLKQRYSGEQIFDLADCESTYPDGRRESFSLNGVRHDALVPAYTNDGGHLNVVGRKYVAAAFIHAIAEALANRTRDTWPLSKVANDGAVR
jgi:hypothetical protein